MYGVWVCKRGCCVVGSQGVKVGWVLLVAHVASKPYKARAAGADEVPAEFKLLKEMQKSCSNSSSSSSSASKGSWQQLGFLQHIRKTRTQLMLPPSLFLSCSRAY
jgi:hypothetical protein